MSAASAKDASGTASKGPSKLPLILVLVNSIAVLAATGFLAYTKLVFKRPTITEETERARLAVAHASPRPPATPGTVVFEAMTVNIAANPNEAKPADGTSQQLQGKLHYVNLGFVLEIGDSSRKADIETLRPQIMDRLLSILGRKQFHELSTVQGRYVLRSQIMDLGNELVSGRARGTEPLVTNVYFTQFIVQ